ncbi:hypothetical protein KP509_14G055700 [Ceratopteris richardii]|uniref:UDP-glycosyltransferases domain-containing protein n=1 Tax=Ceratopteris richardii TaxID=49495 RepID=A0A8T2TD54_CERRI|nr:hypothetical protein KP509_14G055700 [Ceratopteris richardii]
MCLQLMDAELWLEGKKWMLEAPLVECIPGLSPFPVTDLPTEFCKAETLSDPSLEFLAAACENGKEAPCILVNSVYELECQVFDALRSEGYAVEAVGPFLRHRISQNSDHESLQWLNKQPVSSVIYIALGTVCHLSTSEMHALALGLEACGHRFLWVIRQDEASAANSELLPDGFYARTVAGGRGCIMTWVPQEEVLHHTSVGAFFSHCGWNSILESIWEGIPIVACPIAMEQRSNAKYIVEHWKIGVELKRHLDGSFSKEAVEEALLQVMVSESYRKEAGRIKCIIRHAIQEGGSSHSNLIRFQKLLHSFRL